MTATALLQEIERRGARAWIDGDRLRVRPRRAVADIAPEILARADEIARELVASCREREEAVRWRVAAMVRQVPPAGPIPVLAAREGAWLAAAGICTSCGDGFRPEPGGPFGRTLRCRPCLKAAALAIEIGRGRRLQ